LGMGSCGRLRLICSWVPEIFQASREFRAAQGDDGVCALYGPVHAGAFEPGADRNFRARSPHRRPRSKCIIPAGEIFGIALGADCSRDSVYNPAPLCICSRPNSERTIRTYLTANIPAPSTMNACAYSSAWPPGSAFCRKIGCRCASWPVEACAQPQLTAGSAQGISDEPIRCQRPGILPPQSLWKAFPLPCNPDEVVGKLGIRIGNCHLWHMTAYAVAHALGARRAGLLPAFHFTAVQVA
jgi:hypothetical protein